MNDKNPTEGIASDKWKAAKLALVVLALTMTLSGCACDDPFILQTSKGCQEYTYTLTILLTTACLQGRAQACALLGYPTPPLAPGVGTTQPPLPVAPAQGQAITAEATEGPIPAPAREPVPFQIDCSDPANRGSFFCAQSVDCTFPDNMNLTICAGTNRENKNLEPAPFPLVRPGADCRSSGCAAGSYCTFCWGGYACVPAGAVC